MRDFRHFNLIGESAVFRRSLELIERIAARDATVLIQGETGTGKELAARAIHYLGGRRDKPFVPLNCGAIPEGLIESELFGHNKGAFTGATHAQPGIVAQAHNGVLFLDEIDMLSAKGQVAVLRFLQDMRYRPVGHHREMSADVRIIAASNRKLADLTAEGLFRADLLYRLNIFHLALPPLRDREGDVELLAEHFMRVVSVKHGLKPKKLHPDTRVWLRSHTWPGNIRELENFIQRESLLAEGEWLHYVGEHGTLAAAVPADECIDFHSAKTRAIATFERTYLARVISQTGGNVSHAARIANKERRAFAKLLKKHGIDRNAYRA